MSFFFPILNLLILAVLFLTIPVIIGVYVWRDARRRDMNALLWTAISVLVPALIGFVVYLLVRANHSDMQCAACSTRVSEAYVVCPGCGTKLRASCPACAMAVEPGWKVCPKCAADLPQTHDDVVAPVRPKDRALGMIIAAIIIIPLFLLTILFASMAVFSFAGGSSSMTEVAAEEYINNQEDTPQAAPQDTADLGDQHWVKAEVSAWLDGLPDGTDRAYALRYDHVTDAGNESFFLVYVPGAGSQGETSFGQSSTVFGTTLKLEAEQTGDSGSLFCLTSSADSPPKLSVTLDGKRIPCEVTEVDFNPTTYYIMPEYAQSGAPGGADALPLPERMTVVKLIGNHNVGERVVVEEDLMIDILTLIDTAKYLDVDHPIYGRPDGSGGYDFEDGFRIVVENKIVEGLVLHDDMYDCFVFEQDGLYYLIDSYHPNEGRIIRQIDETFYVDLESLFE